MTITAVTPRQPWYERMTDEERARWFRHYTVEQFREHIEAMTARGVPEHCEDPSTLARVAAIVTGSTHG